MVDPKLREMVDAFSSGDVFKMKDDSLHAYLAEIVNRDKNAGYLVNNELRPEVVPAMVGIILSIKQERMVTAIEESNKKTQSWFKFLAIASLLISFLLGGLQILLSVLQLCSSK